MLFTKEAANDPNHVDHNIFTPPKPVLTPFTLLGKTYDPSKGTVEVASHIPRRFAYRNDPNPNGPPGSLPSSFDRNIDYAGELSRLNRATAYIYCDTLDFLSKPADDIQNGLIPRLDYLQASLHNVAHLTNLLRQAQSRESVIGLMKKQIEEMDAKANRLELLSEASELFLKESGLNIPAPDDPPKLRETGVPENSTTVDIEPTTDTTTSANSTDPAGEESEDEWI